MIIRWAIDPEECNLALQKLGDRPSERLLAREELAEHKAGLKNGGLPFDPARRG